MKSLKIFLTLVAVLAMASTAFAEFTMYVVYLDDPVPGLSRYMVKMGGVLYFEGITIHGAVHQAFGWAAVPPPGKAIATPTNDPPLWMGDYPADRVDTHLMITNGTLGGLPILENPSNNFANNETCSLRNEYGCDDGYGEAYFKFGMGTWTSYLDLREGFATSNLLPEGTDFMQIVIPSGTCVYLDGWVYEAPGVKHRIGPEPSAIVMLILGLPCVIYGVYLRLQRRR